MARLLVVIEMVAHAINEVAAIEGLEKTLVDDKRGLIVTFDGAPRYRGILMRARPWEGSSEECVEIGHGQ